MDKIIDNLYLGDIRAAGNLFLLKQHVSYWIDYLTLVVGCHARAPGACWTEPVLPKRA